MKEKNLKLIMELIFIFILPLLFILPNVSITNNYVYDNGGNFETSSKEIEYDSIVYNQYYKNYLDFNQLFPENIIVDNKSVNGIDFINNGNNSITLRGTCTETIGSNALGESITKITKFYRNNHKYLINIFPYSVNGFYVGVGGYSIRAYSRSFIFQQNNSTNWDGTLMISIDAGTTLDLTFSINMVDLTKMFGSGYEPSINDFYNANYVDLSYYRGVIDSEEIIINGDSIIALNNNLVESPFIYIKDLISGFLNIDKDNITFNIVIDYTSIWFLMFILWHLFYCLFDFMIHLIRIKKKE